MGGASDALLPALLLHDPAAEAFRILRTNLEFANIDKRLGVILVTSAIKAEGKTTVASDLALTIARTGAKVLVADLDLPAPTLAHRFGIADTVGLTSVATRQCALEDAIVRFDLGANKLRRIDSRDEGSGMGVTEVLPCGPRPPSPGEFVQSEAVRDLLLQLRDRGGTVLLDTPPLLPVSDTLLTSRMADGLVIVARIDLLRTPALAELRRVLAALETKKLGVVVTGGMAPDACYGYGHGCGVGEEPPVAGYDRLKVPVRVSSHRVGKRQSSSVPHGWYSVAAQACQQSWEICSAQTGELGNLGRGVRGLGPHRGCTAGSTARSYVGRCPSVAARQVTRERQYTHARVIARE